MALQFGHIAKYNHLKKTKSTVKEIVIVGKEDFIANEYPKLLCSFWDESHLSMSVCVKVYNRSLLSKLPSSADAERIFWGDDATVNMHILSDCESMCFIPDALYCYRQFSGGTKKFSKTTMNDLDKIKKYQLAFWEQYQGEKKKRC